MMKRIIYFWPVLFFIFFFCQPSSEKSDKIPKVRQPVDTVGYAHIARQMDSIMNRVNRLNQSERKNVFLLNQLDSSENWRVVICPHDDYSYAAEMYPYVLENLRTPAVIIFGVAHRVKIEDRLIFDSFDFWQGPYGPIPVSFWRDEIITALPTEFYTINDSLHQIEHSVEALLPFLQYYQPAVQIVPILVPYMNYQRMETLARSVAQVMSEISVRRALRWGQEFAFAISNDAVHYGDEDWGGKDYAPFGADSAGYQAAVDYDMNIISECLIDLLDPQGIQRFFEYTVNQKNYKEYAWTWCGRYSIPFGLLTAHYLKNALKAAPLNGIMLRYSTSIEKHPLPVEDLGMGRTSPATIHHWVGYVSIGYR